MKRLLILICSVLFVQHSVAQRDTSKYIISHRTLSVEDGLASREVYCGIQDNDGFIWFGTRNGLNRYDGKLFQLFTKQKSGLKDNNIIQLAKDNNNHLLIAYGQRGYHKRVTGVEVMDLTTHKIQTLKDVFPNLPFNPDNIYWIANDGGDICFLVSKPFQYWRLSSKGFELKCEMKRWDGNIKAPDYITEVQASWYYLFRDHYAVLSLDNGTCSYLITPTSTTVIENEKYKIAGISPSKEIIWFKYDFGVGRYVSFYKRDSGGNFNKIKFPGFSGPSLHNLYIVQSSNHYDIGMFSTTAGLFIYDHATLQKLTDASEFKGYENFFNFFTDIQGNKWFCTPSGVIEARLEKNRFTHYFTKAQTGSEDNNQTRGIFVDASGKVFANVWDKFYCSDGKENTTVTINFAIARLNNKLYTGEKHLVEYDEQTNTFSSPIADEQTYRGLDLCAIDSISKTELLLGYSKTIEKFNVIDNKRTAIKNKNPDFPVAKFVYRFTIRKDKKIWAVAENGLFLLDTNAEYVIDYWGQDTKDKTHLFPFDRLHDAFEDANGIFWLATYGEGLYRWDKNKNEFKQFNITAGFPSDILYRIEEDNDHNLWISTDNGLVRFDVKDFKLSTYTTKEGITHNEFNKISSFKTSDGRMFFGGLDGVNAFYPKDFSNDTSFTDTPLRIIAYSQFSGEEDELLDQTSKLLAENKIVLLPGDRFFNLEFKLLDYKEGKSSYTYKIDGIDKDWNFINQNSIRLSGLPYGKYVLRIRGQSQTGKESKNEITIPIEVITPLVKKIGFQLFLFLLLMIVVLIIIRIRITNLKRNSELLSATVEKRTKQLRETLGERDVLLKEIHHRVKNNLQVIVSLLSMHQRKIDSPELKQSFAEAKTNVRSISLIHENLYQHDSLAGVDMFSFANDLFKLINDLFNSSKEKINFVNNISNIELDIETAVPVGLILNELLTNSFKYAMMKDKEMSISLTIKKNINAESFELMYTDNGNGLPKNFDVAKAKTMGMTVMKDLCRQIGGGISYHFDNGCCFEIEFLSLKGRKETE